MPVTTRRTKFLRSAPRRSAESVKEFQQTLRQVHSGPFTGAELSDGFTALRDEEVALQEEAESLCLI
jgi:hypothetical protein